MAGARDTGIRATELVDFWKSIDFDIKASRLIALMFRKKLFWQFQAALKLRELCIVFHMFVPMKPAIRVAAASRTACTDP
jgi:hypothetical protein